MLVKVARVKSYETSGAEFRHWCFAGRRECIEKEGKAACQGERGGDRSMLC